MNQRRLFSRQVIRFTVVLTVLTSLFAEGSSAGTTSVSAGRAFIDSIAVIDPPPNDNFINAEFLPLGSSGVITGTNVLATKEANEPNHAGNAGGASVWYRWQAPQTARFTFTTYKSNFNTLLAVYIGDSLPGTLVASNDFDPNQDSFGPCKPRTSRVSFNAVAGTVYRIAVDRNSSDTTGNIVLRWGRSATISGSIRTSSFLSVIRLEGDTCRETESSGIRFTDVPTGGSYSVVFSSLGATFKRWGTSDSISPLTGDVSNFDYYQDTPAANIVTTVSVPGGDQTGVTVTCVSAPQPPETAAFLGAGKYQCTSLPVFRTYIVMPSKSGVSFSPPSRTINLGNTDFFTQPFIGVAAPTHTISGRVTNSTGAGLSGVSIALSGSQTASNVSDTNGNYSFTGVTQGGNYTVTPLNANITFTPPSQTFNNLAASQTANFTAAFLLELILEEMGQVAALDSVFQTRDPFPVINNAHLFIVGVDGNTRVTVFVSNLTLALGELPPSVVIHLTGSNNQTYDIPAEDVRPVFGFPFAQVTFRLPDNLSSGTCTLAVKAHGLTSNVGAIQIK